MIEILTGSAEFFPTAAKKDLDYVCFREQEHFFEFFRERGFPPQDRFYYREGITKAELWHWHRYVNGWWLNFAPLVTKGYLEHLGIDIFSEDREPVYELMRKVFVYHFRIPNSYRYGKVLYRVYIYTCYMRNGVVELTDEQRQHAYNIYRRRYDNEDVIRGIYEFFQIDPEETEIGLSQIFHPQEEDDDDGC